MFSLKEKIGEDDFDLSLDLPSNKKINTIRCYRGWRDDGIIVTNKDRFTKKTYKPETGNSVNMIRFDIKKLDL